MPLWQRLLVDADPTGTALGLQTAASLKNSCLKDAEQGWVCGQTQAVAVVTLQQLRLCPVMSGDVASSVQGQRSNNRTGCAVAWQRTLQH